jgi:glycosyltransferase involved in cell wall biosynthesis
MGNKVEQRRRPILRFISRKWPPAVGGMETYSIRLTEALSAMHEVETIVLPGRPDGSSPKPIALLGFGLTVMFRLLRSTPADVTHVGDMASWPLALAARFRSRATTIVLSAHGTDVSFPLRGGVVARLYGLYLQIGAQLLPTSKVIANSRATAALAKRYGWTIAATVPLATDMQPPPFLADQGRNVLFVGRITPRKGCGWFIRNVLPLLPKDITLRVAGTIWDAAEAEALKDKRVEFCGPVYGDALALEYASALCVIVPTRDFEGFGLTAAEAAAVGGVVLAANHSGLRDALIDGKTGFHVPVDDADAWATKIMEIRCWSAEQRLRFIVGASSMARSHYSWERVARETLAAYH